MDKLTVVALGAGGLLLYTMLTKKAAAGNLNFYPASVKNIHFDGVTPVITMGLAVQNTSNQKFTLRSMAGNLFAKSNGQNYLIGNLSFFQQQDIFPNSSGVLWIDIRLSLISVVNDVIKDIQMGNFSTDLKLTGTVNVDNYQIPMDLSYKIGG